VDFLGLSSFYLGLLQRGFLLLLLLLLFLLLLFLE
jgi:hypothetical protein